MKEIFIIYQYGDNSQEQNYISLDNYIEFNSIQDIDAYIILELLKIESIQFIIDQVKVYNKESEEWEDLEHFYVQIEDLMEEDSCYNYENGIRIQLQRIQQPQNEQQQIDYNQLTQYNQQQQFEQQMQISQQFQNQQQLIQENGIVPYQQHFNDQFFCYLSNFVTQNEQLKLEIGNHIKSIILGISQLQIQLQENQQEFKKKIQSIQLQSQPTKSSQNQNQKPKEPVINFFNIETTPTLNTEQAPMINFLNLEAEEEDSSNVFEDIFKKEKNIIKEESENSTSIPNNQLIVKGTSEKINSFLQVTDTNKKESLGGGDTHRKSLLGIQMFIEKQTANLQVLQSGTPLSKYPQNSLRYPQANNTFSSNNTIHMTIMYSEPLVVFKKGSPNPAGEPVEYEQEILQLTKYFQKVKINLNINIRVANLYNFEEELTNSSIIHISCQGDHDKSLQKFGLQFEDKNCELKYVTTEQFKTLLQNKKKQVPKLVFVNACHSEEVGQVFLDANIPFVIAVQSNLKMQDKAAQIFSNSFYMFLMQGYSIRLAFNNAKDGLVAKHHHDCYTCCCAHSHTKDCQWYIFQYHLFQSFTIFKSQQLNND